MVITDVLKWLAVLFAFGLAGLPICFYFFSRLPARGIVFARVVGLLLFGYFYWLGCSLELFHNNSGGLAITTAFVSLLSLLCLKARFDALRVWLAQNWRHLLVLEAIWLLGFCLILLFRLADPNVLGTEKPMEMMFINSILRSESFPPHDAWLSGYSISYYYFGYVISALLIKLSAVLPAAGFNLMLASVFGLAAAAAFALVNDLIEIRSASSDEVVQTHRLPLLGTVFLLIAGNLEGLLEVLHAKHFFWQADGSSAFWTWLGLKELSDFPSQAASWDPTRRMGIWWWRASRVVSDSGMNGSQHEVIDEFPFFSFLLGDLHPHVIGIPFALLAMALSLNLLLQLFSEKRSIHFFSECLLDPSLSIRDSRMVRWVCSLDFWFLALCLGALLFMNTWDFPFYFALCTLGVFAAQFRHSGFSRETFTAFFEAALPLGVACILLYGLFLTGLSSQAGGLVPSGLFTTRFVHLLVMFGGFFCPICVWLMHSVRKNWRIEWRNSVAFAIKIFAILFLLEFLIFSALMLFSSYAGGLQASDNAFLVRLGDAMALASSSYNSIQGIDATGASALRAFFFKRLETLPTMLLLFGSLACIWSGLMTLKNPRHSEAELSKESALNPADGFVLLLLFIAFGILIIPEFFYLRDFFGTRMNTIFKFYYQAWIMFSIAAAYSLSVLLTALQGRRKIVFSGVMMLVLVAVSIYPILGIREKVNGLISKIDQGQELTLDGSAFYQRSNPDDWAAIHWLQSAKDGVVCEKVGNSYSTENAASVFSGQAAILGPTNHESQWRGGYVEIGSRAEDVRLIYESHDWQLVKRLLDDYQVRYVFIGSVERQNYTVFEKNFDRYLPKVFESGNTCIYQVY